LFIFILIFVLMMICVGVPLNGILYPVIDNSFMRHDLSLQC